MVYYQSPYHWGIAKSVKAQDFDSCIRWFESSYPSIEKSTAYAVLFSVMCSACAERDVRCARDVSFGRDVRLRRVISNCHFPAKRENIIVSEANNIIVPHLPLGKCGTASFAR